MLYEVITFKDAKFGIYTHYGPVSSAFRFLKGDEHLPGWHGMFMYHDRGHLNWKTGEVSNPGEPSESYLYHKKFFGDPSVYGYDQLIRDFSPSAFNAAEWAQLFQESGAKFAGPVAMHHDNFAMWNAKSTRWNSMSYGGVDFAGELKQDVITSYSIHYTKLYESLFPADTTVHSHMRCRVAPEFPKES